MKNIQKDIQRHSTDVDIQKDETSRGVQEKRGMHMLSPQEIRAVAGGPESEVGNGLTPPR